MLIDGTNFGLSPLTVRVTAGKHSVRLEKEGYIPQVRGIAAGSKSAPKIEAALEPSGRKPSGEDVRELVEKAAGLEREGGLIEARDLLLDALGRDPANAAARAALRRVGESIAKKPELAKNARDDMGKMLPSVMVLVSGDKGRVPMESVLENLFHAGGFPLIDETGIADFGTGAKRGFTEGADLRKIFSEAKGPGALPELVFIVDVETTVKIRAGDIR